MAAGTARGRAGGGLLTLVRRTLLEPVDADDPRSLDRELVQALLAPIETFGRLYFRAEVRGLQRLPEGPAVLVGNHNAGITFLEPFYMGAVYYRERPRDVPLYFLAHDAMVELPLVRSFLCRVGAVRASYRSADRIFEAGGKLVVYPGGNKEAFRPFADRYRIDMAGRTGFLKLALKAGVPLVPHVYCGGHETFFVLHSGEKLAERLHLKRLLRSETCALFVGLPWGLFAGPMFHLPLPAKSVIEFAEPIDLRAEGYTAEDAGDPQVLSALYDRVQGAMQTLMHDLAAERRFPVLG